MISQIEWHYFWQQIKNGCIEIGIHKDHMIVQFKRIFKKGPYALMSIQCIHKSLEKENILFQSSSFIRYLKRDCPFFQKEWNNRWVPTPTSYPIGYSTTNPFITSMIFLSKRVCPKTSSPITGLIGLYTRSLDRCPSQYDIGHIPRHHRM